MFVGLSSQKGREKNFDRNTSNIIVEYVEKYSLWYQKNNTI